MLKDGERTSGSINTVVRIGNTIRRPTHEWTPTVNHFLQHLKSKDLLETPKILGIDEEGREIHMFIEGKTALRPWPQVLKEDKGLEILSRFVKTYHDAQVDYKPLEHERWYVQDVKWTEGQIIRHGDLGPWNTIWQKDKLQGVIDWDYAEPGDPITDLAQLAWYAIPLGGGKQLAQIELDLFMIVHA